MSFFSLNFHVKVFFVTVIRNGEFHYTLQEAQNKRQALIQMYEGVDKLRYMHVHVNGHIYSSYVYMPGDGWIHPPQMHCIV